MSDFMCNTCNWSHEVHMHDNESKQTLGNVNVTNDISPRKHPASGQSKLSDYKCNKIQVDHDAIEIISNEKILSTAYIVCVSKWKWMNWKIWSHMLYVCIICVLC